MANLSKQKRERMFEFLETLKKEHTDDESIRAFTEIENQLRDKKYGLVWEEHSEHVDEMLEDNIPVFTEDKDKEITADAGGIYNFILEGDNLQSLYLLEKTHRGRIDVIYIDPPYNTKNKDFIYDDKKVGDDDGFKHSKWISFMNVRLKIAKQLLSPDGVLIISIGYQEVNNLMLLCNEIFTSQQVVCVTVQTSGGKPNGGFNYMQEYIVFVTPKDFVPNESENAQTHYTSPYHAMTLANFNQVQRPNQAYPIFVDKEGNIVGCGESLADKIDNGTYTGEKEDYVFDYSVAPAGTCAVYPVTRKGDPCVWRLIAPQLLEKWKRGYVKVTTQKPTKKNRNAFNIQYLADGIIKKVEAGEFSTHKIDDDKPTIEVDNYKTAGANIATIWSDKRYYTTKGSNAITDLIGRNAFSYPKPVELIHDILQRTTDANSIVLDFFAGSGTTGQAILKLNEEDTGHRHFILCTNNENNICSSVTYPRVRTIITGIRPDATIYSEGLPANLKYFKCDWTPRKPEDYLLSNALCLHIREMIELQHGIEMDNVHNVLILNKDDYRKYVMNDEIYPQIEHIWVNQNIIFNSEEMERLNTLGFKYIPREFFGQELREAAE